MNATHVIGAGSLALALVLPGQAIAAGYGADWEAVYDHPNFAHLDIDGNGVLSKGEAAGRKGTLDYWPQIDRNGDNAIDRSEFAAFEDRSEFAAFEALGPEPAPITPRVIPERAPPAPLIRSHVLDYSQRGEFLSDL